MVASWGAVELSAVVQAAAAVASLVVLVVYALDTRKLREVATAQMELLRMQAESADAPRFTQGIAETEAGRETKVEVRNVGATVYDVALWAERPPRRLERRSELPHEARFDARLSLPAGGSDASVIFTVRYRTRAGTQLYSRHALRRESGTIAMLDLDSGPDTRPPTDPPEWRRTDDYPRVAAANSDRRTAT